MATVKSLSQIEQERLVEWVKILVAIPNFKGWIYCPKETHDALQGIEADVYEFNERELDFRPGELLFTNFDVDPHQDYRRFTVGVTFYTGNKANISSLEYDTRDNSAVAPEVEKILKGNLNFDGTWKQVLTRLRKIERIMARVWSRKGEHAKISVPFPPK